MNGQVIEHITSAMKNCINHSYPNGAKAMFQISSKIVNLVLYQRHLNGINGMTKKKQKLMSEGIPICFTNVEFTNFRINT